MYTKLVASGVQRSSSDISMYVMNRRNGFRDHQILHEHAKNTPSAFSHFEMPHITAKGYWVHTKRQKGVFFSDDKKINTWVILHASFIVRAIQYQESHGMSSLDSNLVPFITSRGV